MFHFQARGGLFCEAMSSAVRTPVRIAWVTADLDATERALTGLLGAKKWVRMPAVHFGPEPAPTAGDPRTSAPTSR